LIVGLAWVDGEGRLFVGVGATGNFGETHGDVYRVFLLKGNILEKIYDLV